MPSPYGRARHGSDHETEFAVLAPELIPSNSVHVGQLHRDLRPRAGARNRGRRNQVGVRAARPVASTTKSVLSMVCSPVGRFFTTCAPVTRSRSRVASIPRRHARRAA